MSDETMLAALLGQAEGPGALVRVGADPTLWRVVNRVIAREGVRLSLKQVRPQPVAAQPTDAGRAVVAFDRRHGPTVVHLLDLPSLDAAPPPGPRLLIAAAGPEPGWRRAALLASLDGGVSWSEIGDTAAPAIMGRTLNALGGGTAALIDERSVVDVELLHADMALQHATMARLHAGANLAVIGDELVQFGSAVPLALRRWRLSQLLRGRRGSEWAMAGHAAGARFVLVEADALTAFDPPLDQIGRDVKLLAAGVGDANPAEAEARAIGAALRPLSPVHLRAAWRADGAAVLSWIGRSAAGLAWLDGAEPVSEPLFGIEIERADGQVRSATASGSTYVYAADHIATDRLAGPEVAIRVVQIGQGLVSRPAHLRLPI